MLRLCSVAAAAAALAALAALPAAQEPKPGNTWYEDAVNLGFKVKAPRDWEFVPGSPLDQNLIGKYADPGEGKYVALGNDAEIVAEILLVKFDRRKGPKKETRQIGDHTVELELEGEKDIDAWMDKALDEGAGWRRVEGPSALKNSLPDAKFSIYEGMSTRVNAGGAKPQPVSAYVATFRIAPELDVAVVGLGPAGKKWRTFESAYAAIAKTVQPIATKAAAGGAAGGTDARSAKRAELQAKIATTPGWSLYETPNYFIVSCYDDKQFIEEMKVRLEAIHQVYEQDYPPALARKIQPKKLADAEGEEGKDDKEGKDGGEPKPAPDPNATVATMAPIDALELGRNSVVRVCKDVEQYHQYGGPQGTGGYFSPIEQELVIYDDKQDQGRDYTWGVMNHEGFHQYIHAFFGNIDPHSWYNEGTGDYYFGFDFNMKTKRFTPKKNVGRQDNILLIRAEYVPLRDFVGWSKEKYYNNKPGPWAWYAEGWSLIWFLRTGASKAKGWQKEWGTILDKYLTTLLETSDPDAAVKKAYEGVDWNAFEECWRGYTL